MNLNKAIVVGRLTQDPEARTTNSGQAVSSFSIATNRTWTDKDGQKQEVPEFHNIVAFGKLAEIMNQYLNKGKLALIEGRLQTRSWEDQNGIKRYRTEIIAENMQMGPQGQGGAKQDFGNKEEVIQQDAPAPESDEEIKVEDIPF